ncbi:MAG: restriction endonuclease subunit S [Paludibacteraceae bacterium]|nr:restriction endonuclease subunit S [Paludibacteraceae bacterium]
MNDIKIDKTGRKKYRFDEVCCQVNVSTKNPEAEGLKYVVGLEHIEPNNLHITRWDTLEKETTFTRKFIKGQVLFGRRRAYQRKVAYTEFDGICSGDILVFEAINDVLIPELLPFLIQSEGFFQKALETSAGSLSPRTKFKDLADYEFLLPPKAEQQRLAELLWAADDVVEKEKVELERVREVFEIKKSELIWKPHYPIAKLNRVSKIGLKDGDWIESKDQSEKGIRLIQLADIGVGTFINKSRRYISEETFNRLHCFEVLPDDILLARMPDPIGRSCIMPNIKEKCITAVDVCIIRINENICDRKYLNNLINTQQLRQKIIEQSSGTTRQRISRSNLEKMEIPFPDIKTQNIISIELDVLENNISKLEYQISLSQQLKQELINKIF